MRSIIFQLACCLCSVSSASATDLLVSQTPQSGAVTTITAAMAAAVDGDRILVEPSASPYSESFTITKSVQLLSSVEGQDFIYQGTITLGPTAQKEITLMNTASGSQLYIITSTIPSGLRSRINVLGCHGVRDVTIAHANWDLHMSRCESSATYMLTYSIGTITANFLAQVMVTNEGASGYTNYFVGNNVFAASVPGINYQNTSVPLFMAGNQMQFAMSVNYGFQLGAAPAGGRHIVENNLMSGSGTSPTAVMQVQGSAPSSVELRNNLFLHANGGAYMAVQANTPGVIINAYDLQGQGFGTSSITIPVSTQTNTALVSMGFGTLPAGSEAINAGDPAAIYSDLDLSRNDIGCQGGSFAYVQGAGSFPGSGATVTFLLAPRSVVAGATFAIQAEGFDR